MKNIKNTWKGIKSIISLKAEDSESPKIIKTKHGETVGDPIISTDYFNFFFLLSSPISPRKINCAFKLFQDFLKAIQ